MRYQSPHARLLFVLFCVSSASSRSAFAQSTPASATIDVDAGKTIATASEDLFGQNLEHEHGAISGGEQNAHHEHGLHTGGLWAEMLRDRKFEEGDVDRDGVADGWVPEERITNDYVELVNGQRAYERYRIDTDQYYGGGASQAIDISGPGSKHASVYQIGLQFTKGRRYVFYVYLKQRGHGAGWVTFGSEKTTRYSRQDFTNLSEEWAKYTAQFTAPEDTESGRIQIGFEGSGTFWIDSASLMPADNYRGMRSDVVEAVKPLKVPILRYPGGCFADIYHWKDGIGDRDRRPERWSSMWNEWEPNDFGTDEFMDFARATGFKPQITANYLTGTVEEAAQWLEYTNGSAQTQMGKLRAQNGNPEPYGIKFWAFGNEVQELCSGEYIGKNDVHRYAKRFEEFRDQMLQKDPSVHVMAVGAGPGPLQWNRDLVSLVPKIGLLGVSIYTGEGNRIDDFDTKIMDLNHFYRHVVAEPTDFTHQLQEVLDSIAEAPNDNRPQVAVTEFQSWWLTEKVDEDLRLADALYVGSVYNSLLRHANHVQIAEVESLINVQGIIEASQTSIKLTPEYFTCLLYRLHTGKTVLSTSEKSPPVAFNPDLPMLDAIATLSGDRKTMYLAVVNRAEDADVDTTLNISGWRSGASQSRVFEVNGKDKVAANPFGSTANVNIREKSVNIGGPKVSYRFPAHSVTVIEIAGGV